MSGKGDIITVLRIFIDYMGVDAYVDMDIPYIHDSDTLLKSSKRPKPKYVLDVLGNDNLLCTISSYLIEPKKKIKEWVLKNISLSETKQAGDIHYVASLPNIGMVSYVNNPSWKVDWGIYRQIDYLRLFTMHYARYGGTPTYSQNFLEILYTSTCPLVFVYIHEVIQDDAYLRQRITSYRNYICWVERFNGVNSPVVAKFLKKNKHLIIWGVLATNCNDEVVDFCLESFRECGFIISTVGIGLALSENTNTKALVYLQEVGHVSWTHLHRNGNPLASKMLIENKQHINWKLFSARSDDIAFEYICKNLDKVCLSGIVKNPRGEEIFLKLDGYKTFQEKDWRDVVNYITHHSPFLEKYAEKYLTKWYMDNLGSSELLHKFYKNKQVCFLGGDALFANPLACDFLERENEIMLIGHNLHKHSLCIDAYATKQKTKHMANVLRVVLDL